MTTKNRPGPKCKPAGTTKVRHNVMLSPDIAEAARQIGYGNLSAGLELAVKHRAQFIPAEIKQDKSD